MHFGFVLGSNVLLVGNDVVLLFLCDLMLLFPFFDIEILLFVTVCMWSLIQMCSPIFICVSCGTLFECMVLCCLCWYEL